MKFFVYIIYSKKYDVYYKGMTHDLDKRLWRHNNNLSNFTKNKGPWELVYSKAFDNKKDALIEENRLKKLNRNSILNLIKIYNS